MSTPGVHPARIEFHDWGWRYADRDAWAVRGVDLVVEPGERIAVVGPSGAGKSTLLRAVAAVLPDEPDPDDDTAAAARGTVLVDGAAPQSVRGRVGLVMQDPEAHTVMSRVGDDVAFGCENTGVPRGETWERVRSALDVVGLDLPLDRPTTMLSGGQRQRLALAGVLAMRPGALVLDEPCANLDPDGVEQVHDAVEALLADTGSTLLVVEHRIGTWLDLVDRLVLLEPGGGVVADGPPAEVLAAHGDALTAAGVWVPGAEPARGSARTHSRTPDRAGEMPGSVSPRTRAFRPLDRTPAPQDAELLVAEGLGTTRGKRQRVGSGIDLRVRAGRVLAVTGPNGVGKSTLGLTLAGLLRPAEGTLRATEHLTQRHGTSTQRQGTSTQRHGTGTQRHGTGTQRHGTSTQRQGTGSTAPYAWSSRDLAARIGTVFQDPQHQFVARTVREELAAGPTALGMPDTEARVDDLLDAFGLRHVADANPFTLSGGEARRLAIGTVVATDPPVIVLDEPTSGQDRATWQAVVDRLGALADAGTAVVAVTHDRDLVRALDADELVLSATRASSSTTSAPTAEPRDTTVQDQDRHAPEVTR